MKYLLCSACFVMTVFAAEPVMSQGQPIFITPYEPATNTYASRVPSTVRNTTEPQQQSSFRSNRLSGPGLTNNKDPFAGTGFGRIKQEIDYFDRETGRYYNQYDYMALLSRRGDRARLADVTKYIQKNGVFDPQKYQVAMTTGPFGSTPQQPVAMGAPVVTQGGSGAIANDGRKRVIVMQEEKSNLPTKVHNGYDDDPAPAPTQFQKGAPIFLR